jgi:hypothetical protein
MIPRKRHSRVIVLLPSYALDIFPTALARLYIDRGQNLTIGNASVSGATFHARLATLIPRPETEPRSHFA